MTSTAPSTAQRRRSQTKFFLSRGQVTSWRQWDFRSLRRTFSHLWAVRVKLSIWAAIATWLTTLWCRSAFSLWHQMSGRKLCSWQRRTKRLRRSESKIKRKWATFKNKCNKVLTRKLKSRLKTQWAIRWISARTCRPSRPQLVDDEREGCKFWEHVLVSVLKPGAESAFVCPR